MSLRKCQILGCEHDAGLNGLCLEHACVVWSRTKEMRAREKRGAKATCQTGIEDMGQEAEEAHTE